MTTQKGNAVLWLLGLIALGVLAYFIFTKEGKSNATVPEQNPTSEEVVIEGEVVCLPHRDTSGPTTMECTYGLKTDNGDHYALDATASATPAGFEVTDRIAVEGTLVPTEQIPGNYMQIYNIVGMVTVSDYWEYRDK